MRFNDRWFNQHLENMGQRVLWRRSYSCPCVNPNSKAADPKCPLCRGKSHIYADPVEATAAPASQKAQNEWAELGVGIYEQGDIVITIPASSKMWESCGEFDRVTLLNATDAFNIVLTRGAVGETLLFKPERIDRVFWRHPQTKQIVEGAIPTVDDTGIPTWDGPGAPPPGTTYSVAGRRYSEYHLFREYPQNRNMHSGMKLPKRVVIRRYDLANK